MIGSYDRVFSSRLIPHIELENAELARKAIINMGELLNSEGEMIILRRFGPLIRDRMLNRPASVKINKRELQADADAIIANALSDIRLPDIYRVHQRIKNVSGAEYFGQAEWRQPDSKGRLHPMRGTIWDPKQHEFVNRMGLRGQIVQARFLGHVAKEAFRRKNEGK